MIDFPIPKKYTMQLDNIDKKLCSGYVARLGIDGAIESQFKHLDCSRVKDGLRLMQTIGVPYTYEMSKLAFILYTYLSEDEEDKLKAYLFSGQTYVKEPSINVLASSWINALKTDAKKWLNGEFDPTKSKTSKKKMIKKVREFKREDDEDNVEIGGGWN